MLKRLQNWWRGEEYYIEDVLPGIRYRRHWTSNLAHISVSFYLKNWQWCLGFIVAIAGLTVAIMKLG